MNYRLFIVDEAIEFMLSLRKRGRQLIRQHLETIRAQLTMPSMNVGMLQVVALMATLPEDLPSNTGKMQPMEI